MRSKAKGPKHWTKENVKEDKSIQEKKTEVKNEEVTEYSKKEFWCMIGGIAVLAITSLCSISFAINSKTDTAISRAYQALDTDLIRNGVFIEEVNIGGLTKEQAVRKGIAEYAGRRLNRELTLKCGAYEKTYTYADLGGSYDIEETVDEAYKLGRSGSKEDRIVFADNLESKKEFLVSVLKIDQKKLKSTIREFAREVEALDGVTGKVDVDLMAENIKHDMTIQREDIVYNAAFE